MKVDVPIGEVRASAFKIPIDRPEADGTIAWNSTTLIVVQVSACNWAGLSYPYAGSVKSEERHNTAEEGNTANIKQDTTNKGFFRGRRMG